MTLTPCPYEIVASVASLQFDSAGTMPSDSPGNPSPVVRPNPKRFRYDASVVLPTRPPTFAIPMLLDSATMSASIMVSTGCSCESWIVYSSTSIESGTWKRCVIDTAPDSMAAAAVITLLTDPGSNASVTATFRSRPGSCVATCP